MDLKAEQLDRQKTAHDEYEAVVGQARARYAEIAGKAAVERDAAIAPSESYLRAAMERHSELLGAAWTEYRAVEAKAKAELLEAEKQANAAYEAAVKI